MQPPFMLAAMLATSATQSSILYAAIADGTVKTLNLSSSGLSISSSIVACGPSPSWLTLTQDLLYCSGEATPGTLSTFQYDGAGKLTQKASINTTGGDVSSTLFGNGKFIALAHYGHNKISTYAVPITSSSKPLQDITLPFPGPGPNPRQDTGYPHQVILDPSGRFLFSPDLGADRVRVFSINNTSGIITQVSEIKLTAGTGPRHVAFYKDTQTSDATPTFVYVAAELSNKLSGYRMDVDKSSGVPSFTQIVAPFYTTNTTSAFLAEARVYGKTLTVSNRGDASFGTGMDSLTTFAIGSDGTLSNEHLYPSGGNYPRSFEISKDGTKVAVGDQKSKSVVVMRRDSVSGAVGETVGRASFSGEVIDVIWSQ